MGLSPENSNIRPIKSLGARFLAGFLRANRIRPASFYLLMAMLVVLILGGQIYNVLDDPKKFAFFLSLNFLFFFVVIFRAIVDAFDIAREHFRENETLMTAVFTRDDFADRLGREVTHNGHDGT